MKQLTTEQIDALFTFTKKHYVEFYDVQVELVDHLANAIEEQWKENPNILYEDALQIEFKKFGVFGFTGLVEQKQAELHSYYTKMLWSELLKFISIPKVVVTIALYLAIFFFLKNTGEIGEMLGLGFLVLSFAWFMVDGLRFIFKIKKEQKKKGQSWLIQSVAKSVYSLPTVGICGGYFQIVSRFFGNEYGLSSAGYHFLSIFLVIHFITFFIFFKIIKPSLNRSIHETEKKFQFV